MENISEEDVALKKMGLSPWQDGVIKLSVFNTKERKHLLESWKAKHPETKKSWGTVNTREEDVLRCQSHVIIK